MIPSCLYGFHNTSTTVETAKLGRTGFCNRDIRNLPEEELLCSYSRQAASMSFGKTARKHDRLQLFHPEFGEFEVFVAVLHHADRPCVDEQKKRIVLEVLDALHVGSADDLVRRALLGIQNPADMLVRKGFKFDFDVIFALQAEL